MRESRTYGSVRGARGNSRPYREAYADEWRDWHIANNSETRPERSLPGCVKTLQQVDDAQQKIDLPALLYAARACITEHHRCRSSLIVLMT